MANAFDQFAANASEDRRDQTQPQARDSRREDWHGNQPAFQAPLPGIFLHQVSVTDLVRSPDLICTVAKMWQVERGDQVAQDISDGNRLSRYANPAGGDHHRQSFHQRADQLERKTAGSQNDRGSEFNHRDAAGSKNVAHLVPTAQVR